jgi:putative transposase
MKRSKFTEEQTLKIVRGGEAGRKVADLCRTNRITEQIYYRWKAKYGGMELSEMQRLKQLETENRGLKQIVAEQALDIQGRPDFAALMSRRGKPVYAAFDLLALDGEDLRSVPLLERKARLEDVMRPSRTVRYVPHVRGNGREFFAAVCRLDLEGVISKPADSSYTCEPSPWRKVLNPRYSQKTEARFELFDRRRSSWQRADCCDPSPAYEAQAGWASG